MSATVRSQSETEYADYSSGTRWVILIALMMGALMQVIDTSIVNVAMPQMMGNLGATMDQIGWVSTGYIISSVILLPLTGWLSSTFGRKRYLTTSIIIFTLASLFCGSSRSLHMLVFFRVLQGMGGAALISTAQATMMEIFPPHQLGMVQAIYGVGIMVGPTIGPTFGGWITDNYSWPWIFYINIPIGILAATLAFLFVRDSKFKRVKAGVDFVGIGMLALGLASLQTVLEKGNREGWFDSTMITSLTIISVISLIGFVFWELNVEHPAVNLRILKNASFASGTVFTMILGFGLFGGTFILPIYLQELRHYTAMQCGLIMLPGALASGIMMPIVGKFCSRFPARNLVLTGMLSFIASMFMLHNITMDTGPEHLFWPLVLRGGAMGLVYLPLTLVTLTSLKPRHIADGTGLYNLSRQIGGSFGIAILSTFVDRRTAMHRAFLVGHINNFSNAAIERFELLQQGMIHAGCAPAIAAKRAYAIINGIVQGQASIMAFEDTFLIVGIVFILSLPLLLFFKKGQPAVGKRISPEGE